MTEVAFHFNIPDRIAYVCRLLRKAVPRSESVVVVAQPSLLERLDQQLWALSPTDFIGHVRLDAQADAGSVAASCARVWLTDSVDQCTRHDVLVSLLPEVPVGFGSFARLIEVVSFDEEDRQQARLRWRHYTSRGYQIIRHDVQVRG